MYIFIVPDYKSATVDMMLLLVTSYLIELGFSNILLNRIRFRLAVKTRLKHAGLSTRVPRTLTRARIALGLGLQFTRKEKSEA